LNAVILANLPFFPFLFLAHFCLGDLMAFFSSSRCTGRITRGHVSFDGMKKAALSSPHVLLACGRWLYRRMIRHLILLSSSLLLCCTGYFCRRCFSDSIQSGWFTCTSKRNSYSYTRHITNQISPTPPFYLLTFTYTSHLFLHTVSSRSSSW
jgi:hypothetical protein